MLIPRQHYYKQYDIDLTTVPMEQQKHVDLLTGTKKYLVK